MKGDTKEEKRAARRRIFKIAGVVLFLASLAFLAVGTVDFFKAIGDQAYRTKNFWCLLVGLPLFVLSVVLLFFGFMKSNSTRPKIEDEEDEEKEESKEEEQPLPRFCPYCGGKVPEGSAYCNHCGRKL